MAGEDQIALIPRVVIEHIGVHVPTAVVPVDVDHAQPQSNKPHSYDMPSISPPHDLLPSDKINGELKRLWDIKVRQHIAPTTFGFLKIV